MSWNSYWTGDIITIQMKLGRSLSAYTSTSLIGILVWNVEAICIPHNVGNEGRF